MFITLEGIEGSGKTTQVKNILEFMSMKGIEAIRTQEPGGTNIGGKIRTLLLDPENKDIHPMTELLLYFADRTQHYTEFIKPLLQKGKAVVCDRFFESTLAYQGYARGMDIDLIKYLHKIIFGGIKPDITLLFDLPAEIGLTRALNDIKAGNRPKNEARFEKENILFHEKVRNGYLEISRLEPDRIKVINALLDKNKVKDEIFNVLSLKLDTNNDGTKKKKNN
ncbi:MAG: dTMP kinase [Desulfobacterales bacterium]|nr:dTMP kinase [Desulfobacterales bacterium]